MKFLTVQHQDRRARHPGSPAARLWPARQPEAAGWRDVPRLHM